MSAEFIERCLNNRTYYKNVQMSKAADIGYRRLVYKEKTNENSLVFLLPV